MNIKLGNYTHVKTAAGIKKKDNYFCGGKRDLDMEERKESKVLHNEF